MALSLFIWPFTLLQSAEVIIQHGKEGVVEITVGGLQKTKMTMQWPTPTNRVTRAIFDSPIYGNYEFLADLDQDINSAIIVLTTSHGIHKFAYQIHNEDKFELTTTVESPLISGGNPLTFPSPPRPPVLSRTMVSLPTPRRLSALPRNIQDYGIPDIPYPAFVMKYP